MIGRAASNACTSLVAPEPDPSWLPEGASAQAGISLDDEVQAMVAKALHWVISNLDEFDPFKDGRTFEMRHGQKLAELAMMVHGYAELTGDADGPEVRRILGLLRSAQRSRELCDRLLRAPAELVLYCILYVVLRARGDENPALRRLLQRAIDAGFLDHTERVIHRQMDVGLYLEWGGFDHSWPSPEELYASSLLGRPASPLLLDENAVYALTHILMFVYGFGLRAAATPVAEAEAVRRTLSLLLVAACQEHHWDLLAELLLCWDCVGFALSPIYERSWQALLGEQRADGAIPGPESALADLQAGQISYFAHHYHTTLVSIIAGALHGRRSRERRRPASPAPAPAISLESSAIAEAAQRARGWLAELLENPLTRRPDALCRILLGCWICDSMRGEEDFAFPDAALRIGGELLELDREEAAFESVPSTLKLIVAALLSAWGIDVPALRDFALQSAELLWEVPASDSEPSLDEKRFILHTLGLCPAPEDRPGDPLEIVRALPLTACRDEVEGLALELQVWTGHGTRCRALAPADRWIAEMIAGLATHCLRQYNFLTACKLLRALVYLGAAEGEPYHDCVRFLLLNQRSEGAFGFFGPEEGKLRNRAPEGFSADLDLYLPVTVSCLWALGEGPGRGWRLYASLPRIEDPAG
jgi:uncharacterized protein DUF6895